MFNNFFYNTHLILYYGVITFLFTLSVWRSNRSVFTWQRVCIVTSVTFLASLYHLVNQFWFIGIGAPLILLAQNFIVFVVYWSL